MSTCAGDDEPEYSCPAFYGPSIVVRAVDKESGSPVCGLTVVAAATFSTSEVVPDEDGCIVEVVGDDGIFDLAILADGYETEKVVGLVVRFGDEPCTLATVELEVPLTPVAGDD